MKFRPRLVLSITLCCAGPILSSPAAEIDWDAAEDLFRDTMEVGREWIEENVDQDIVERFEDIDVDRIRSFWLDLVRAMRTNSYEDLLLYAKDAENVVTYLENFEATRPYGVWLRTRMDYFEVAEILAGLESDAAEQPTATRSPARPRPSEEKPPHTTREPTPKPARRPAPKPKPSPKPAIQPDAHALATQMAVWEQKIKQPPKRAAALALRLKRTFSGQGVPPEWIWLAEVESSFNPSARSPVGARGLFQFMPATAQRFGLRLKPDDRIDPDKSARAAASYLKILYRRFNSWPLALAAYNAGEGRVGKLLKRHQATRFEQISRHLPCETRLYVPKVLATVKKREGVQPISLPAPRG